MKLFIMRHGESVGNTKQGFISGQTDKDGLTDKGRVQIVRTAYELRNVGITALYASPVTRAQETARIIAGCMGLNILSLDWLTELDHGMFEGSYWWEVIHKIPPRWRKKREDFTTAYPGGGESMATLADRIWKGINCFVPRLPRGSKNILISHQAPIATMQYLLQQGDPATFTKKQQQQFLSHIHASRMSNGGYIEVTYKGGKLTSLEEKKEFEPINERKQNVSFYVSGILAHKKTITVERQETVSQNTVYHLANDKNYLMKVLHAQYPHAADRQVALYAYLHTKMVSTPHIIWHDQSKAFFETEVLIQDYIIGAAQNECLAIHPKQACKLLKDIFVQLNTIHSIPVNAVKSFWISPVAAQFRAWRPFMIYNINFTLHHISELSLSEQAQEFVKLQLKELKRYIRLPSHNLVPIHGDFAPDNIIVSHTKKSCTFERIIDFEWARIGDRLWDFAYYWGWLERESAHAAMAWKKIVAQSLSEHERAILELYRILFHAWTVRDTIDYKDDRLRRQRGERSREILNKFKIKSS